MSEVWTQIFWMHLCSHATIICKLTLYIHIVHLATVQKMFQLVATVSLICKKKKFLSYDFVQLNFIAIDYY